MKKLIIYFVVFLFFTSPIFASDIPGGVKPQEGRASGTMESVSGKLNVHITFWNVGEMGGSQYAQSTLVTECTDSSVEGCSGKTIEGTFAGGPEGSFSWGGSGKSIQTKMINGSYIELQYGKPQRLNVEDPGIFSGWGTTSNTSNSSSVTKLEDSGAAFSDLFGQVEVNIPNEDGTYDDEKWDFAKLDGKTFPVGTHIKTSEKSGGYISFADMTTYTLKPGSEIILSSPAAKESQVKLLAGNLWINIKKMFKDGSMEIEMSQAVAGIKGTRFVLNETGTESSIWVTDGTVKYTSKSTGKSIEVSKGESVTASSEGLSEKTTFDPVTEEKQWQELEDNLKRTNTNILANKNILYFVGGIVIVIAIIMGFLILKTRKAKRV